VLAPVRLTRPTVQLAWTTVRLARPIGQPTCPIARLNWTAGRVDGEIVRVVRAVGQCVWAVARLMRTLGHVTWPLPACPPMAERRFPRPDGHFAAYMNNYFEAVKKWWDTQGLGPSGLTPLEAALAAWNTNFAVQVALRAEAAGGRQNKDAARRELDAEARPFTSFIQGYPKTTDADRATIGITIRAADGGGGRSAPDGPGRVAAQRPEPDGQCLHRPQTPRRGRGSGGCGGC